MQGGCRAATGGSAAGAAGKMLFAWSRPVWGFPIWSGWSVVSGFVQDSQVSWAVVVGPRPIERERSAESPLPSESARDDAYTSAMSCSLAPVNLAISSFVIRSSCATEANGRSSMSAYACTAS